MLNMKSAAWRGRPAGRSVSMFLSVLVALLLLPALALFALPATAATGADLLAGKGSMPEAGATQADVRKAMRKLRKLRVPSVRTLITTPRGQERYTLGPRRLGRRAPARIGDAMRVGSVTKMMTGAIVMQLAEEGRLALSDSIEDVLPGVVPGGAAITIEQLLGMRSGLASYNVVEEFARQAGEDPQRRWQPDELLDFAFGEAPEFAPGEKFHYSNTNTILLGLVIEKLTGHSYANAVRDRIARPLKLRRTKVAAGLRIAKPRVDGYVFEGERRRNATNWSPSWGWAAGGAVSTPAEIGRFIRALLSGRLVERASLRKMLKRASRFVSPPFPPTLYGLALSSIKTDCGTVYGHGGEISGYRTWVAASRDGKRSVVISAAIGATVDGELPARIERTLTKLLNAASCRGVSS